MKNNIYQYAAISPIKHTKWHVATFFSTDALYRPSNFIPIGLIAIAATILMAALMNTFINRTFVKPFEKLKESIQEKELLQDREIYGLDRKDEFGVLAKNIQSK